VSSAYLRRSEITTWARDKSTPITVKVIIEILRANVYRPTLHTNNDLSNGNPEVVELVALNAFLRASSFYAGSRR
jgi:hypothetical protein